MNKSVAFLTDADGSHTLMLVIYLQTGGIDYNGKNTHISDTCTMHWEIYYIHPQFGHTCYGRQQPANLQWQNSAERHRHLDR